MSYERYLKEARDAINAPCETEADQRVHDNLVRLDTLKADGHTAMCAGGQVFAGKPCTCKPGHSAYCAVQYNETWECTCGGV